jgi:hypothetical protein
MRGLFFSSVGATFQREAHELTELNHQLLRTELRAEIGTLSTKVDALAVRVGALEARMTSVEVAVRSLGRNSARS